MVKIDAPPYAPLIVLTGVLAAIGGFSGGGGGGGNTADVTINLLDNGTPTSGDIELVGIGTQTGSTVVFPAVPFGIYSVIGTATGLPPKTVSISVHAPPPVNDFSIDLGVTAAVTISNASGTATGVTFTTDVTGQTGTVNIQYNVVVHASPTGAVISSGTAIDAEANGTYSGSVTLSPAVPTGTFPAIITATIGGVTVSNADAFNITVGGGGGITSIVLSINTPPNVVGITVTPSSFSGTVSILNAANQPLVTDSISGGFGTVAVPQTALVQNVHVTAQGITSNTLPIPPTGGGGLTALHITAGTLTATAETINVTATPLSFSGGVALRDAANVLIGNVQLTAGHGSISVTRTTLAQVVHASFNTGSGLITSNTLTVPATAGGGGLTALVVSTGTLSGTTEIVNVTATPLTFSGTVAYNRNSTDTFVTNCLITNGHGAASVPRLAAGIQNNIHAYNTQFAIRSNNLAIPPLASALSAVINSGTGTNAGLVVNTTISNSANPSLIGYTYSVRNTANQIVAAGTRVNNVSHNDGTFNDSISPLRQAGVIITLPPGPYTATVHVVDGTSGVSISPNAIFSFTVQGTTNILTDVTGTVTNIAQNGTQETATIAVVAQGSTGPWSGTLVYALSTSPSVVLGHVTITNGAGTLLRLGRVGVPQTIWISQSANSLPKAEVPIAF